MCVFLTKLAPSVSSFSLRSLWLCCTGKGDITNTISVLLSNHCDTRRLIYPLNHSTSGSLDVGTTPDRNYEIEKPRKEKMITRTYYMNVCCTHMCTQMTVHDM